ncbi:MAG: virulence-associated protein E, partial [Sphingobium sp.]
MPLTARKPSQELIDLVGALGGTWHGRTAMCLCPGHNDRTPSLSLRQGDRGILVTCFAGCEREDILRELRRVPIRQHYAYTVSPSSVSGNAVRLWDEAQPVLGTLAERYLAGRHLLPVADDLRFHPRCPYRPRPWTSFHPALLVAVREGRRLTAV